MKEEKRLVAIGDIIVELDQEFDKKYHIQHGEAEQFELLAHGISRWTKLSFARNGVAFYELTRTVYSTFDDEQSSRREYFRGHLKRRYIGPQNCFIEFCWFMDGAEVRSKSMRQKILLAADALKLDMETARMYSVYYKRFFGSTS